MEDAIIGSLFIRAFSFGFVLLLLPKRIAFFSVRVLFVASLLLSSLLQAGVGLESLRKLITINSAADFFQFFPSLVNAAYNVSIGVFFALIVSSASAVALLVGHWTIQMLQSRFSKDSIFRTEYRQSAEVAIPVYLLLALFLSDFFYFLFVTFQRSISVFPLTAGAGMSTSFIDNFSALQSATVVQLGAHIFFVSFVASGAIFLGVLVLNLVLLAGVRYLGNVAIRLHDGGLVFIFMALVVSISLYAGTVAVEKTHEQSIMRIEKFKAIP